MKLVLIIGSGAVGKMTVGQELMKITDLRLFHNHMIYTYFNPCINETRVIVDTASMRVRDFGPSIAESPMSIYCKVDRVIPLGSHDMFIADIAGIGVDEALIDEKGKLCLDKAGLAAFAHGEYFELGKKIGAFGFSVAKKKKKKTPAQEKK